MLSRRSFAKWLLAVAATLLMPGCKREDEMPIGDIFLKEDWTQADRQTLRREMNKIQTASSIVSGWVGMGTDPHFKYFTADQAKFTFMPLGFGFYCRNTAQTIPNNTKTAISLGEFRRFNSDLSWDSGDPTKIKMHGAKGSRVYAFVGNLWWANNSTGYRNLYCDEYDQNDTYLGGQTIHNLAPTTGTETAYSFAGGNILDAKNAHMKFSVQQTSGGNLNLGLFRIYIWRVY